MLGSMRLTDEESTNYSKLTERFERYFIPRRNVIYERARFNLRSQMEHESVEEFITEVHRLAGTCDFGSLKEELIRDRLVVGLRDKKLSERLQLDSDLTLEKAVSMARNSEAVRGQQSLIHGDGTTIKATTEKTSLDALTTSGTSSQRTKRPQPIRRQNRHTNAGQNAPAANSSCRWCGSVQPHGRTQCPAHGRQCNNCKKLGHFASVCLSAPATDPAKHLRRGNLGRRHAQPGRTAVEEVFLGELLNTASSEPWYITALVDGTKVRFKIDTGADVTALPRSALPPSAVTRLQQPTKVLYGPERVMIDTIGQVKVDITWNGQTTQQEVFVVRSLQNALLGRPAIRALNVLPQLLAVEEGPIIDPVASRYSGLFGPLGHMDAVYGIKLVSGAVPHAVTYPRRVPIPLLPSVQAELRRMEDLGVIRKINHPTQWCAPMVVAKKKDGKLRICVDYAALNKQIMRERLIMPTVEESLSKINGAKLFSKLDANAGYWQAPLTAESSELTTFITPLGRYQFLRLPFGISTAPEFFQREMLRILEGREGTTCHMDDILIYGENEAEHDRRLYAVLRTLCDAGITLNA